MSNYILTKKSDLKTSAWAGGTTTQLAIFPAEAEYQKFNFDFRISYATVEVEESTFTYMPGVTRTLMILKGSLEIDHIDRFKKHLNKFDIDVFSGEWPTKAKGKVTDFNLMTRGGTEGSLEAVILNSGETQGVSLNIENNFTGIYLLKGDLQIENKEKIISLESGDFILFNHDLSLVNLIANDNCEIIISKT